MKTGRLAEIEAQEMALRGGWLRLRDEAGEWSLASIPPLPMVADDIADLLAEVRALRTFFDANVIAVLREEFGDPEWGCYGDAVVERLDGLLDAKLAASSSE